MIISKYITSLLSGYISKDNEGIQTYQYNKTLLDQYTSTLVVQLK